MSTEQRIARVRDVMTEHGLDGMLVRDNSNLRWLTGLAGIFDEEQAHAAFITADQLWFHTDSRYSEAFSRRLSGTGWACDTTVCAPSLFVVSVLGGGPLRIGVEDTLPLREFMSLQRALSDAGRGDELVATRNLIFDLRAVKDDEEVACIRRAQEVTDAGFAHICEFIRPGMTERQVALELEFFMRSQGSEGLAFPSIVATGARGASPHSLPSDVPIESGDLVVIDFGARVCDYCSDMTRTVSVGSPSPRQVEVYETVRDANRRASERVEAGAVAAEVHAFAERIISQAGFAGRFNHALGHGVGIDIHENPVLAPRAVRRLVPGNVVTVEPGIYLPGEFGVRVEDFGVVTQGGFDVFTASPHELMVL